MRPYLFTSESVSEGHPDKVCDRISDMVVDTYLSSEPQSRVDRRASGRRHFSRQHRRHDDALDK